MKYDKNFIYPLTGIASVAFFIGLIIWSTSFVTADKNIVIEKNLSGHGGFTSYDEINLESFDVEAWGNITWIKWEIDKIYYLVEDTVTITQYDEDGNDQTYVFPDKDKKYLSSSQYDISISFTANLFNTKEFRDGRSGSFIPGGPIEYLQYSLSVFANTGEKVYSTLKIEIGNRPSK